MLCFQYIDVGLGLKLANHSLYFIIDSFAACKFFINCYEFSGNLALLNTKRGDKQTPLHLAASNGHLQIAQLLISNGAKINKIDDSGSTPLILAAKFNHHLIEKYLLEWSVTAFFSIRLSRLPGINSSP